MSQHWIRFAVAFTDVEEQAHQRGTKKAQPDSSSKCRFACWHVARNIGVEAVLRAACQLCAPAPKSVVHLQCDRVGGLMKAEASSEISHK